VNKRVTKIGWIVLAALLCLSLILVPGCTTPAEEEEEEEEPLCSIYVGSGELDGNGIPLDFFTDVNFRIGCCYAFDYDRFIAEGLQGNGIRAASPLVVGLSPEYVNPDASMYEYDLVKAERYLKLAWGGELWEKGCKFTMLYNSGNVQRKTGCEILADELQKINGKFEVSIQPIAWPTYLGKIWGTMDMPMFCIGWLPDYPHPDNFIQPYMESTAGAFSAFLGYGSPALDAKIKAAFEETDLVAQKEKYYELQEIWHQDPNGIIAAQVVARRYFTGHIDGFYYNPCESAYPGKLYYMSKAKNPASAIPFKNPDTFIEYTIGDIESYDPAWCYDTAGAEQIGYAYETLVYYDGESTSDFVPVLATDLGTFNAADNTLRFQIREGVKFHEGGDLTAEDVEYTFERALVQDRPGGPTWMLYGALLGVHGSDEVTFADIAGCVEVDGDSVVFHMAGDYWVTPFYAILAHAGTCIVDKEWCIANGDWDGTEATWMTYNQPADPGDTLLFDQVNGTGPWKLNTWEPAVQHIMERFDGYWQDPAPFKYVYTKIVDEWTARKLALQAGDADLVFVPSTNYDEMDDVEGLNVYKDLPSLNNVVVHFNQAICGPSSEE
jgi:ABC-type transport system substrate-binding protein